MIYLTFGVRELQARLGEALEAVRRGDRVLVTSHRRPVALLCRLDAEVPREAPRDRKRRRLASEGKLLLGQGGRIRPFEARRVGGLSDKVLADRR